jgi:hypothetical protein
MKITKILILTAILTVGATNSVFAAWWNPLTWKVFTKRSNTVTQNVVSTTTVENLLSCNGSKYRVCVEGQTFVCPTDGQDAYCEKNKTDEIKTPKTKDTPISIPVTTKAIKSETVQKPKTTTKETVIENKPNNNPIVINNAPAVVKTDSSSASNDDIYDSNNIMDKDGNAIVITQNPNYKFSRIVTATRGGIKGFYYKDTKTFKTEQDIQAETIKSQDESDRQFSRGIYAPTAPRAPAYDANNAAQEKQAKLDAVNLEIANLNAKYAEDVKNVKCFITYDCENKKSSLQSRYIEDYNVLQAKYQQIKYSN